MPMLPDWWTKIDKPRYGVPSMAHIDALEPNGFNMVSTFSGCGGSCLGFKMQGFNVCWANEFIPAARETYAANHPATYLDARDIRDVTAAEILEQIGLPAGALDVFEGSPPCASFSSAGRRSALWGQVKQYSETRQRTDDLFYEWIRLLDGLQPKVCVAENVSGLVRGVAKGFFLEILRAIKACGYRVEARLLDAQWLGVPQLRQRIIFIGTRADLPIRPQFPAPLPYRYTVREAVPWIANGAGGGFPVEAETDITRFAIGKVYDDIPIGGASDKYFQLVKQDPDRPCGTIMATATPGAAAVVHPYERRKFSIAELKRLCGFPDDFRVTGEYQQQHERLGRAVPPVMMSHIAKAVKGLLQACEREEAQG